MAETLTIMLSITVCWQAVSHYLLDSSSDRHSSWEDEQNLTMDFYSFHFIASRRAGFRDCWSLAVATTLTRSHVALRALCASILQLDKPIIESKVMHTFACFFLEFNTILSILAARRGASLLFVPFGHNPSTAALLSLRDRYRHIRFSYELH